MKTANDLFLFLNIGNIFILDLLHFFQHLTNDHYNLIHHLHVNFKFIYIDLQWFSSYLTDQKHYISLLDYCSALGRGAHNKFSGCSVPAHPS